MNRILQRNFFFPFKMYRLSLGLQTCSGKSGAALVLAELEGPGGVSLAWGQAAHCFPLSSLSVVNMFSSPHFGTHHDSNSRLPALVERDSDLSVQSPQLCVRGCATVQHFPHLAEPQSYLERTPALQMRENKGFRGEVSRLALSLHSFKSSQLPGVLRALAECVGTVMKAWKSWKKMGRFFMSRRSPLPALWGS